MSEPTLSVGDAARRVFTEPHPAAALLTSTIRAVDAKVTRPALSIYAAVLVERAVVMPLACEAVFTEAIGAALFDIRAVIVALAYIADVALMIYCAICSVGAVAVFGAGHCRETLSSSCTDAKGAAVLIAQALRFGHTSARNVAAIAHWAVDVAATGSAAVAVTAEFARERPRESV